MANRRMFSLDVVDTDKFLDMPASAQALYFNLGMRTDENGFISSLGVFKQMRYELELLEQKGYITKNEFGIYVDGVELYDGRQ